VFRGAQADVLLDGGGTEPAPPQRVEPVLAAVAEPAGAADPPLDAPAEPLGEPSPQLLDAPIAAVARVETAAAVPAQQLNEAQQALALRVSKALRWVGVDDQGQWTLIGARSVAAYRHLRAALLLADRQGALGEAELETFCQGIAAVAERLGGTAVLPDRAEVLARARALDEVCARLDIQIAVHVVHRDGQALSAARVGELAAAAGLRLGEDGLFHAADAAGAGLFSLSGLGSAPFAAASLPTMAVHGITFWLDVPRVAEGAAVFERMIASVRSIAAGLDGVLVDDQRSPLSDAMLVDIRAKIDEIQQNLAAQGIPAGGTRAQRLFA
jgi:hypothetical protein